jgi:hypothetical protein
MEPPSLIAFVPVFVRPGIVGDVVPAPAVVVLAGAAVVEAEPLAVVVDVESLFLSLPHEEKSRPRQIAPAASETRFFIISPVVVVERFRRTSW